MKKIVSLTIALTVTAAMMTGCSSWRKKSGANTDANGNVISETTGGGGAENVSGAPMNFAPTGSDSGSIEGLSSIQFDYDRATLPASERAKLDANVAWMKKNANVKMQIEGHCDQRGSTEYNLSLGERRALAVKKLMTEKGIAADRLTTVSYGKEKLLATGDSEAEMARNRRANFVPSAM